MHKVLAALADLRLSAVLLLCFALDTLLGTLMQASQGLWAAQEAFFHSWIARIPLGEHSYVPFVGVPTLGVLAIVNLSAVFFGKLRWTTRNTGLLVLHAGLILLLLSAGASWLGTRAGFLELGSGEKATHYESGQDWELVLRSEGDSGATQWTMPLQKLRGGDSLDLGPLLPPARVVAYHGHGMLLGSTQKPVPLPPEGDPGQWTPVLSLEFAAVPGPVALSVASAPWVPRPGRLLYLRKTTLPLPFQAQLLHFVREMHPGTGIAARYESTLRITENGQAREVRISMNEPLRVGRYTLFQSSWKSDPATGTDRTVLAVVENPWRNAPYAATLVIALGLLIHTLLHVRQAMRSRAAPAALLLFTALLLIPNAHAGLPASWERLPIQVDGRVKPLDTYAHHLLLQISGRSRGATAWYSEVLLGDGRSDSLPVFLIENPENRDALGLRGKARDRYSWAQLEPLGPRLDTLARMSLLLAPNQRSRAQRDLLRIADSWNRYYALRHALDLVDPDAQLPILPRVAQGLTTTPAPRNFYEFVRTSGAQRAVLDSLLRLPGNALDSAAQGYLDWIQSVMSSTHAWSALEFTVYPAEQNGKLVWQSPGIELLAQGPQPDLLRHLRHWQNLRTAWKAQDTSALALHADSLFAHSTQRMAELGGRPQALSAEHLYNKIDPFFRSLLLYGLAAAFALAYLWSARPLLLKASYTVLGIAWILQIVGMALRSYLTLRPPATNLYETFVFSAACAVLLALGAGTLRKLRATPLLAAGSGALLLMLARRYGMDGDTMPVLAAVLDSNFWLTIHVLSITLGYAGVLVAGLYAHLHLYLRKQRGEDTPSELAAFRTLRLLMMIGLLFTFVGTLLGAVWADQSWGRFWGWDPKENGALIIILWVAFLFHAGPCGWMGRRGFALGSIFAIQTVLFAWFGVNLMGVGLHSYGFTAGTLQGLLAFASLELAYVAWTLWPYRESRP